jgi:hypothetical protein
MSSWTYTASNETNLMKIKYGKLIEKQFAQDNVLFGRVKKMESFVGKQVDRPIIQSIGGGVSAGSLPTANESKTALATITSKKLYAACSVDRETMKAAKKDEGSFVRMTSFPVKMSTKAFNRNLERMITRKSADGTIGNGALIGGNASNSNVTGAGSSGCPYVINFSNASTYFPAEFQAIEVGDILHVNSETSELEVVDISETVASGYSTGSISVVGTSTRLAALAGSGPFAAADYLFMQQSKGNELTSIGDAISASSGSLYGVPSGRRWQAYQKAAGGAALSTDLMNDVVINMIRQSGEAPNLILMGHHQYTKFLNLLEDQKVYNLPARDKKFKGQVSFSAIEYISPKGVIPVVMSRFLDSDEVYFLNDNHIEMHLRPGGFEWFDEDGTVFLRNSSSDVYDARYGGYGQLFVNPHFQGYLSGLAV